MRELEDLLEVYDMIFIHAHCPIINSIHSVVHLENTNTMTLELYGYTQIY